MSNSAVGSAASAASAPSASSSSAPLHLHESKAIWKAHGRKQALTAADVPAAIAKSAAPTVPASSAASSSSSSSSPSASASAVPAVDFVPLIPIDETQFDESVTVTALRVPAKLCGNVVQHFKQLAAPAAASAAAANGATSSGASATPSAAMDGDSAGSAAPSSAWLISRPRISAVIDGPTKDTKIVLLSEWITSPAHLQSVLPPASRSFLDAHPEVTPCLFTFKLGYGYFAQDAALARLLPPGVQVPSGFETVGHIAHLNLSAEQAVHGALIARVILDKNPHLFTVVNKTGAISSEFRVFAMDVLAGVKSCVAEVREHGCSFRFDFSRVYWNSRLSTEHARLIDCFKPRQLIVDMMCGIGPFVVPAARALGVQKGYLGGRAPIYANDLNPDSFASLQDNLARNSKGSAPVSAHNMDGRAFLWEVVRRAQIMRGGAALGEPIAHVAMNLPAIAVEFLDAFVGLYATGEDAAEKEDIDQAALSRVLAAPTPLVHVYCFSKSVTDPLSDLVPRVERALGGRRIPKARWVKDGEGNERKGKRAAAEKKGAAAASVGAPAATAATMDLAENVAASAVASSAAASSSSSSVAASGPEVLPALSLPSASETFVRFVRNVAPNKDMFCVQFRVPLEVLMAKPSWRQQQKDSASDGKAATMADADEATADSLNGKRKVDSSDEQPAKKSREAASDA